MIFIPYNVPSSKNSKVKTKNGIFNSPAVSKYLRKLGVQAFSSSKKTVKGYVRRPNLFELFRKDFEQMKKGKEYPVFIGYHHVRDSRRKFDFSNSIELIQDLLTAHDFITDDNVDYVFPVPMTREGDLPTADNVRCKEWYSVDKNNSGVYLKLF